MRRILLLSTALLAGSAFSQTAPVANLLDIQPTDGEVFEIQPCSHVEITQTGANQTWDLSGVIDGNGVNTLTAVHVNNPANEIYIEEQGARFYRSYNSSGVFENSISLPGAPSIVYSNPKQILKFPLQSGLTHNGSYSHSQQVNGNTLGQTGTYSIEYVGYGTLITPAGTFNDVICILAQDFYATTTNNAQSGNGALVTYYFYKPGYHQPIAQMGSQAGNGTTSFRGSYLKVSPLDVDKMNKTAFVVAPNPATDGFTIAGDNSVKSVQLFDLNGKEISVYYNATTNFVDVSSIPAGVYHLQVITDAGIASEKVVKR